MLNGKTKMENRIIDMDYSDDLLTREEQDDLETADETIIPVTYSGQDFDVDGLIRRLSNEDMIIPRFGLDDSTVEVQGFQRGFVWSKKQMDRFIETLLLEYPVPGIFLVRQQSDKRFLVLDGQQRLLTIKAFHDGKYRDKTFRLENVAEQFKGLSYEDLPDQYRRTFDNSFIQATVVNMTGTPESREAVYQIFERLNSGGTQLTAHEIRVAVFSGNLVKELVDLNNNNDWREIYGTKINNRLRDQELILRILSLYISADTYKSPLKTFLNKFMSNYRNSNDKLKEAESIFIKAASLINASTAPETLRGSQPRINNAILEAFFIGLMHALANNHSCTQETLNNAAKILMNDTSFIDACTNSTANADKVKTRLDKAYGALR